jgi:hypothetical protein
MTDLRHRPTTRSHVTGGSLLGSQDRVGSHLPAGTYDDIVVLQWYRLRTIVDALLPRVATSPGGGTVGAAMITRPTTQERADG